MDPQQPQPQQQRGSSGSLRTKISLKGSQSQVTPVCPFYGMKDLPPPSPLRGSDNLLEYFGLSPAYKHYCESNKVPEDLASYLPNLCGRDSLNLARNDITCSLRQLVEKPPITGKEICALTATQMMAFKLTPGPVPDNYRFYSSIDSAAASSQQGQRSSASWRAAEPGSSAAATASYQEFGRNFNDPEAVKEKHRKRAKRALDELEAPPALGDPDRKGKRHRAAGEEKEREKHKKSKKSKRDKKEKKKKVQEEESSRRVKARPAEEQPFF